MNPVAAGFGDTERFDLAFPELTARQVHEQTEW
jgi:hypothetical protein